MAKEGSYEIMPYKEMGELKKQIAELKKRAVSSTGFCKLCRDNPKNTGRECWY